METEDLPAGVGPRVASVDLRRPGDDKVLDDLERDIGAAPCAVVEARADGAKRRDAHAVVGRIAVADPAIGEFIGDHDAAVRSGGLGGRGDERRGLGGLDLEQLLDLATTMIDAPTAMQTAHWSTVKLDGVEDPLERPELGREEDREDRQRRSSSASIWFSMSSLLNSVRSSFAVSSENSRLKIENVDETHRVGDLGVEGLVGPGDDAERPDGHHEAAEHEPARAAGG